MHKHKPLETSPAPADEIRKTTCYMCACRCGIDVHIKNKQVSYIEGNRDHPVNKGVLCAKGSAGILQLNAPSRLNAPLLRTGERGSGEFQPISWDKALSIATERLSKIRRENPSKLCFFTGRDQSQSFTSFWAQNFGTPNYAAHGGFCSVNMATAGIYTMGGAFWEFGQPDWEHTKLLLLFGVAEDHDSNPIKMGIGKMKSRGGRVIGVNPIRTGYNAVADDWVGIKPGTDGLFVLSLIYELLRSGKFDREYLAHYTNAPVLIDSDTGLFLKDEAGTPLVIAFENEKPVPYDTPGITPNLLGATGESESVFRKLIHTYLTPTYAPEKVAPHCGIAAETIKAIAKEIARVAFMEEIKLATAWTDFRGRQHQEMVGRPVSFHAMRGISAHGNGFQTCRAIHILQILLGSVEVPGGFRFKPPYPKPSTLHPVPHAECEKNCPLDGPHLGFVHDVEDLAIGEDGKPLRIDKAFTWEYPLSAHGLMHMVISNIYAGDPYSIDTLFFYMANMSWNSSMNTTETIRMLTAKKEDGSYVIPYIIYSDAYSSEMVAYADLILPDTTYLERYDCISLLDRPICEADMAADAIRWPVIEPDRDVRGFQSVLCDLGARLGLKGFVKNDGSALYKNYADYMIHHLRKDDIGPLMGFRGKNGDKIGRGEPNPQQLERYKENGGFFKVQVPDSARYYKPWNKAYQDWAVEMGFYDKPSPYLFQLYLEPLRKLQRAAEGEETSEPPPHLRDRIKKFCTPFPSWWQSTHEDNNYPIYALTQRPMAMYHSWGTQNAWLRQIHGMNPIYIPTKLWKEYHFNEGDWVQVTSPHGTISAPAKLHEALNSDTIWTWNAIGKRKGTWAISPDAPEATQGVLFNHLIHELLPEKGELSRISNSDPITGQAAWFDLKVRIEKIAPQTASTPRFPALNSPVQQPPKHLRWQVSS